MTARAENVVAGEQDLKVLGHEKARDPASYSTQSQQIAGAGRFSTSLP